MQLGPFILEKRIGKGGMGEVWQARHATHGARVAVKLQRVDRDHAVDAYLAAFEHEVRTVAALRHPHVVEILDQGLSSSGQPWLAMRLAEGTLRHRPAADWGAVRDLLAQVLAGLAHAHARGVVHRDLKPANVLWGDGRWMLADFGVALAASAAAGGPARGTPAYMAPEQIRGSWRDHRPSTDLYALGCVAWQLVCGKPPFHGRDTTTILGGHLHGDLPPFEPGMAVPDGLEGWLARLLQKRPADRFSLAADAAWTLQRLGAPTGGPHRAALPQLAPQLTWFDADEALDLDEDAPTQEVALPSRLAPLERPPLPRTWVLRTPPVPPIPALGLGLYGLRAVPLAGRASERDRLWEALREVARDGRARVLAIEGQPGIGKTALAAWLSATAQEVGAAHGLWVRHSPLPGPMDGLSAALRAWLQVEGMSAEDLRARTERLLRERGALDPHAFGPIVGLLLDDPAVRDARRYAAATLLSSTDRPVVVVLDDAQWGPEATDLARWLAGRAVPALLVCTCPDGALDDTLDAPRIRLGPLDVNARLSLLRTHLDLDPELAAELDARTQGHPQFALQLLSDWVQRGLLESGPAGFRLTVGRESQAPVDLPALWSERLDRALEGHDASLAELMAALGGRVQRAELEAAAREAGLTQGQGALQRLARHGLVEASGQVLVFPHQAVRELLAQRARDGGRWCMLHRACARALATHPDRAGRHLLHAGDAEEAAVLLSRALAEGEFSRSASEQLALARTCGAALREAGVSEDDPRWARPWLNEAEARRILADHHVALALTERICHRGARPGWATALPKARRQRAVLLAQLGRVDEAVALTRENLAAAERVGDPEMAAHSRSALAQFLRVAGEPRQALQEAEAAVDSLRRVASPQTLIEPLLHVADIQRQLGDLEAARIAYEELRRLLQGRPSHALARTLNGLGELAAVQGDVVGARALLMEARKLYLGLGSPSGVSDVVNQLAELARREGDLDEAERGYRESLAMSLELGLLDAAVAKANLGLVLLARGRWAETREVLEEAAADFRDQSRLGWEGAILAALSPCLIDGPGWDAHHAEIVERLQRSGISDPDVAWALRLAATRAEELGHPHRAADAWQLAAHQYERLDDEEGLAEARAALASLGHPTAERP